MNFLFWKQVFPNRFLCRDLSDGVFGRKINSNCCCSISNHLFIITNGVHRFAPRLKESRKLTQSVFKTAIICLQNSRLCARSMIHIQAGKSWYNYHLPIDQYLVILINLVLSKAPFSLCRCSHGSSRCRTAAIP